ncbi:hypothetical protein PR048_004983 [Dryococelus australis]|uniref:Centromere protein J C-terminal domain-containing protein n=1 Tax=Dryococelus australis TaxID=614101 RepID=A0ABQ9I905_9NEOP|nr:hypothetical protein PR048_004983 [Dryococelus australis]
MMIYSKRRNHDLNPRGGGRTYISFEEGSEKIGAMQKIMGVTKLALTNCDTYTKKILGRSGVMVRLLPSHQGKPGSISSRVASGFSYARIVPGNENQELLAFELLEQHAANSSFSSSSSFVAALMERTVKSTPKKSVWPELGSYMNPMSVNTDVHKQYTQNYKKYISSYPKSESKPIPVHVETTNKEFNVGCEQASKTVYNVAAEERNLHVHFADEDENEGSEVSDTNQLGAIVVAVVHVVRNHKSIKESKALFAVTVFSSELLTSRLQDLENEMEIFEKANIELAKIKKDHEDNVRKFTKEKKSEEKKLKEEEERIKNMLEEERRKLGKERLVLQKHSKSLKNHPSKEEREEIQALKQQGHITPRFLQLVANTSMCCERHCWDLQTIMDNRCTEEHVTWFTPAVAGICHLDDQELLQAWIVELPSSSESLMPHVVGSDNYTRCSTGLFDTSERRWEGGTTGQTEYHYTDGSKKVTFADGSIKLIYTTGQEEWVLPDNTHWTVGSQGEKVVTLPNGDKEISTEDYLVCEEELAILLSSESEDEVLYQVVENLEADAVRRLACPQDILRLSV